MAKEPHILFLYQVFLTLCLLAFVTAGFVITWALFFLRESRGRRPGINIREL